MNKIFNLPIWIIVVISILATILISLAILSSRADTPQPVTELGRPEARVIESDALLVVKTSLSKVLVDALIQRKLGKDVILPSDGEFNDFFNSVKLRSCRENAPNWVTCTVNFQAEVTMKSGDKSLMSKNVLVDYQKVGAGWKLSGKPKIVAAEKRELQVAR